MHIATTKFLINKLACHTFKFDSSPSGRALVRLCKLELMYTKRLQGGPNNAIEYSTRRSINVSKRKNPVRVRRLSSELKHIRMRALLTRGSLRTWERDEMAVARVVRCRVQSGSLFTPPHSPQLWGLSGIHCMNPKIYGGRFSVYARCRVLKIHGLSFHSHLAALSWGPGIVGNHLEAVGQEDLCCTT